MEQRQKGKTFNKKGGILIPVSPGELLDKIVILNIKAENIKDPLKIKNIKYEISALKKIAQNKIKFSQKIKLLIKKLENINKKLWDFEKDIRKLDKEKKNGKKFILLARSIHQYNDLRGAVKKEINLISKSKIVEEKSYES